MKKVVCILIVLFAVEYTNAQIEADKAWHFVGGNLYGLAGAGIAKQITKGDRFWTFAGAIGGSVLVGLGKEAIDSNPNGSGWDNGDLLATILGGAAVGVTIDIFTDHKSKRKKTVQEYTLRFDDLPLKQLTRLDHLIRGDKLPRLSLLELPDSLFLKQTSSLDF